MSGAGRLDGDRTWGPEEGWPAVALVALLGLILATAMDEPAWVNGRGILTDCLALCAVLGAVAGFAGPKVGWGRWRTHLIGALFAGILLPVIAGWTVEPGATAAQAFRVTAEGTLEAYLDLTVRGRQFTTQEVHYVLVLAGLVWGTMQFGSYAVFGHRRPLAAVMVVGGVLLANMALTRRDQLGWLVFFALVALFLLIQMHTVGERSAWTRRRIGDPGSMALLYLRGGAVFIVLAMAASLVLTANAKSSPLAGAWGGLNSRLVAVGEELGRLFPVGGDLRGGGGVAFGASARIAGQWFNDNGTAFTASVPLSVAGQPFRAATYDQFVLGGWEQSSIAVAAVAAGDPLLEGSPEIPAPDLEVTATVTIKPDGYHDTRLLSPGLPSSVGLASSLALTGEDGWFAGVDVAPDQPYTVTALIPQRNGEAGITQNKLRAASTVYPAEVTALYTSVPDGAMGPYAQQLLASILARTPSASPFDLAKTTEDFLRSSYFSYTTDIRGINCTERSQVECFARYRQGYCLHYASTMAILLRAANPSNPIPTRLVQGFLPSDVIAGTETVLNRQAHAWVEVYFPGFGWMAFDPTGGGIGRPNQIPEGRPVPAATAPLGPGTSASGGPRPTRRNADFGGDAGSGGQSRPPGQPADRVLGVLLAGLLAVTLGALIVIAWWRGPRGEVSPDTAWAAVSRAASRFGFGPRATQTVYEYAESLASLVPVARPDITTVADAKVETTYARAELTPEREHAVTLAMRRLRVSLVRLVAARLGRRRRRR